MILSDKNMKCHSFSTRNEQSMKIRQKKAIIEN